MVVNVLSFSAVQCGIWPDGENIIITGHGLEEWRKLEIFFLDNKKRYPVFYNRTLIQDLGVGTRKRTLAAEHKARTLYSLHNSGFVINSVYECDLQQIAAMQRLLPKTVSDRIVHIKSSSIED